MSDVSWENEQESIRQLERNQEIEAIVLSIDVERERISLGLKQLKEDAFFNNVLWSPEDNGWVASVESTSAGHPDTPATRRSRSVALTSHPGRTCEYRSSRCTDLHRK